MKPFFISLLLLIIPFQLGLLYLKNPPSFPGSVAGISQSANVENSVSIGEFRFKLFGYTSPKALLTFEGLGIYDQTKADEQGYFQFNNRFSPFSSREACLSSKDQFGRLTSPTCLPPFPVNYNISIGPVIMPPTISLDKKDYFMGDQVILSGQAIPNTKVNLSMFGGTRRSNLALIKSVEAYTFPQLDINSDSKGNFSINLPSSSSEKYRLFATTDFQKTSSPNSVKLNLEILPIWMIIVRFFLFIFSLVKDRLLEIIIMAEIIYLLYFLKGHINKAIVLYASNLPDVKKSHLPETAKTNQITVNNKSPITKVD